MGGRGCLCNPCPPADGSVVCERNRALVGGQWHVWPASLLQSQGVNGEDLVSFETAVQFSRGGGLSMFAAQKILRLRDQHLALP